jgi:hypothetical protein
MSSTRSEIRTFLVDLVRRLSRSQSAVKESIVDQPGSHRALQILTLEAARIQGFPEAQRWGAKERLGALEGIFPLIQTRTFEGFDNAVLEDAILEVQKHPALLSEQGLALAHDFFLDALPGARGGARGRKEAGAFYTPPALASALAAQLLSPWGVRMRSGQWPMICDPAAGHGQLLISVARQMARLIESPGGFEERLEFVAQSCLWAFDINERALQVAHARLVLLAKTALPILWQRMRCLDPLDNEALLANRFDLYFANPPYGLKHPATRRLGLGSKDVYGAFLLLVRTLKAGGRAAFIVSDTFLTLQSHEQLRQHLLSSSTVESILELPSASFNASVATVAIFLRNQSVSDDHEVQFQSLFYENSGKLVERAEQRSSQALLQSLSGAPLSKAHPALLPILSKHSGKRFCFRQGHYVALGDVVDIRVGLQTGDNNHYLRQLGAAYGRYDTFEPGDLLTDSELGQLSDKEKAHGISPERFGGRSFIPFDKGGRSLNKNRQFSDYYRPPCYALDWSERSVRRMRELKGLSGRLKSRMQNLNWYFQPYIVATRVGVYSPTFRLGAGTIFDSGCTGLFSHHYNVYALLGVLCSSLIRYLFKSSINHTVNSQADDLKRIPLPCPRRTADIETLTEQVRVLVAARRQQIDKDLTNKRRKIDRLVYDMFSISKDEQVEIEQWLRRRYPCKTNP